MKNHFLRNCENILGLFLVLNLFFLISSTALAAPVVQVEDPVAQCAQGVKLFENYKDAEALPLLEDGIINRANGHFAQPDDLGDCASTLGVLLDSIGKATEAIEAYKVAIQVFGDSGNRRDEGAAYNNIGFVYQELGRSNDALRSYYQALTTRREVGDRGGESTILTNIGGVYGSQGQYDKALESYQKALAIQLEVKDRAGEGRTLTGIGAVYDDQGRFTEAMVQHQKALAIMHDIGDRAGEGAVLNNIGSLLYKEGKFAEALEQLNKALLIVQETGDRARVGSSLNNIGTVYEALGRYDKALESYQQALVIFRELGDRSGEGDVLYNIGVIYKDQGRYAEALDFDLRGLEIAREIGDRAVEGHALSGIGTVYDDQGRYDKALESYQQSLAIIRDIGDRAGEGVILSNIGGVYSSEGRYDKAMESYQQALTIHQEVGDRVGEGATMNNIAVVYFTLGRNTEALELHQQALSIVRDVGDQASESRILKNIAAVYSDLGRDTEALDLYRQALITARKIGDRVGESQSLSGIGLSYSYLGQYIEALDNLRQALAIQQEVSDRPSEGITLNNIGFVYGSQGQHEKAMEIYQQALAISMEIGDRYTEGIALSNIGKSYNSLGQIEKALKYYEQALNIFEMLRSGAGSETARANFIDQHSDIYELSIELYYQQNQPEKAFLTSERGRARAFLDTLATGYVELTDNKAAILYAREQEAYAERQAAQDALTKAKAHTPLNAKLITDLEAQQIQAEEEYKSTLDAITARGDQLTQLVPGRSTILELPQMQALLDNQTTLLSFWVLDEQTLVFILTRNTFNSIALPISREDLYNQIKAFRNFDNTDNAYPESSIALYHTLIEPLKPYLTTSHLTIVPQGNLHYLSFAGLTDGSHYLIDDYTLTYLPSVNALKFIQVNTGRHNINPLILGNPNTQIPDLKSLPYAESEVQAIASLYQTTPLIGQDATESVLRSQGQQAGVVHLAAHGNYNPTNPLLSAIYLAPDVKNDGMLETQEVYGLKLGKTDLVVLSACDTQLGKLSNGDELVGLTRAFFFAGTPSVISSLWNVDDRATQLLMVKFYDHWLAGMGKAQALQQAQIEIRKEYPNPYYWAAFELSGDGGVKVPALVSAHSLLLVCLFIGLCCVGGIAFNVIRRIVVRHARTRKMP